MKKSRILLLLLVILSFVVLCCSCNLSPLTLHPISIPMLPAALTNSPAVTKGNGRVPTQTRVTSPELEEYGEFVVVPEIGYNYNLFVETITPFIEGFNTRVDEWDVIQGNPYFQKEFRTVVSGEIPYGEDLLQFTVPLVYRTNMENTLFELYSFTANGETRVLTVEKLEGFTHALLLMYNTSGDVGEHDSVEILQSETRTLTKCIRVRKNTEGENLNSLTNYQLFVANTDRTSEENNTIGSIKKRNITPAENDPYDLENAQVGDSGRGYFNDIEKRILPEDDLFDAYIFPDYEFTSYMYTHGLSIEAVHTMAIESYSADQSVEEYEAIGSIEIFKAITCEEAALYQLLGL